MGLILATWFGSWGDSAGCSGRTLPKRIPPAFQSVGEIVPTGLALIISLTLLTIATPWLALRIRRGALRALLYAVSVPATMVWSFIVSMLCFLAAAMANGGVGRFTATGIFGTSLLFALNLESLYWPLQDLWKWRTTKDALPGADESLAADSATIASAGAPVSGEDEESEDGAPADASTAASTANSAADGEPSSPDGTSLPDEG